ncbi:hypothetical protein ACEPAG_4791 [Sanghuangporus baumii]
MGNGRKGGVSKLSRAIKSSQSSSSVTRHQVVASRSLAERRVEVDRHRKQAVTTLLRRIEQHRRENEMDISSFEDLDFMVGMDANDLFDILDDEPMNDDEVRESTGMFDGSEFIEVLKRRKPSKYNREEQRQRKRRQAENWTKLYPELVNCYLAWSAHGAPDANDNDPRHTHIDCFNLRGFQKNAFPLDRDRGLTSTMLCHGYVANAPLHPKLGVSIELLNLFSAINGRCGNVGVIPFVRAICDFQQMLFKRFYSAAFTRAFDVYVELLYRIDKRLDVVLRTTKKSKLQKTCPSCLFKTDFEEQLPYSLLVCVDGNDSLKRLRQLRSTFNNDAEETVVDLELDDRNYRELVLYVEEDVVDRYKHEVKKNGANAISGTASPSKDVIENEATPIDGSDEKTPCTDRWVNLSADSKKRMWGTFDETGIFVATCRHGVVLSVCDMIRSGELAKYPLAILDNLIDVVCEPILCGYDIGCGFSKTVEKSELVGPKARQSRMTLCVNAFHGHAHCRKCQLKWHPLYTEGAGLEDFEACERVFSQSNRIATCTRHMSKFRRCQAIVRHFDRWNLDKYMELSTFLLNNLRQAHKNIHTLSQELETTKARLGIDSDDVFLQWRLEELEYLKTLQASSISIVEQLEMDYVDTLKCLKKANKLVEAQSEEFIIQTSVEDLKKPSFYRTNVSKTTSIEEAARNGLDTLLVLQSAARRLEEKLGIERPIDRLEGLIVARLFELLKMNQAGTGYKLWTQISKALQTRSEAIRTALKAFNTSAGVLGRPTLELSTVLDYVFLRQFNLLRGSRHDVLSKPWSHEEVVRVEVEIRQLKAHIEQERREISEATNKLDADDPLLALQLRKRRGLHRQIDAVHQRRLKAVTRDFGEIQIVDEYIDELDAEGSEEDEDDDEDVTTALDTALDIL